ncbi:chemotaxis protein MotA [candidate division LCP-89 bacterium B3_LCP]|uniref:Chemotaxis protein MotA n=1 Tax=candidate division LCP-89 bacterium B3_LCP TaxID=2012998 RepID=A0A532V0I1_UNCL8|nr:MAG: chemotaxis protein MotA [candidate division LCP-89 bacterium B3_LCP]
MDIGTIAGLVLGLSMILGSFLLEGGALGALVLLPAIMIVVGGTFATALIGNSIKAVTSIPAVMKVAIFPPSLAYGKIIDTLVEFATVARRDGVLALERELEKAKEYPFLYNGMLHLIDGLDADSTQELMEGEKDYLLERHHVATGMFKKMGAYSPTMGIIGTVMGLINTLASAGGDPVELVHHIASAFIATLWGVFMANVIWLPIADKLEFRSTEESLLLDVISNGIISIQSGTSPTLIRRNLELMLPPNQRGTEAEEEEEE